MWQCKFGPVSSREEALALAEANSVPPDGAIIVLSDPHKGTSSRELGDVGGEAMRLYFEGLGRPLAGQFVVHTRPMHRKGSFGGAQVMAQHLPSGDWFYGVMLTGAGLEDGGGVQVVH